MARIINCRTFLTKFSRNQAEGESHSLLQQQQSQQQLAPLQDNFVQSRATALQNVESTIHELGNIFTQLATMVSQQGELAIRLVHICIFTQMLFSKELMFFGYTAFLCVLCCELICYLNEAGGFSS